MKRHPLAGGPSLACGLALGLALLSAPASAQESPPPSAPAAASGPPASASPASASPASGPPVRVHLGTYKRKGTARLFIHRTDGSYAFVCESPCTADMAAHSEVRVTLANNDDEPHTFGIPSDLGSEIDVEVRPASVGPLVGSIVLMGSGGALVLSGALFVALSGVRYPSANGTASTRDSYKTVGFVFMGLGAATAAAGLIWLLSRSHEPKVEGAPHRAPEVYGRRDTVLGDVAVQKPRDATTTALPALAPFELSFTF